MLAERHPRLHFNLSHSGDLALIAVTKACEVGIDVEREDDGRDFARLARRGLDATHAEAVCLAPPEERAKRFYAAWVRREASSKCLGTGLGAKLPRRPVAVRDLEVDDGYAAAVALTVSAALPLRRFDIADREPSLRNHGMAPFRPVQ